MGDVFVLSEIRRTSKRVWDMRVKDFFPSPALSHREPPHCRTWVLEQLRPVRASYFTRFDAAGLAAFPPAFGLDDFAGFVTFPERLRMFLMTDS
jgi:hypothetical protein